MLIRRFGLLAMAMVVGLSLVALGGCGSKDTADAAVGWLESGLKDGSVFDKLSSGERMAFSRLRKGLRSKGRHVLDGLGVQYRIVRVESIDPVASELREKGEDGNWDDFVPEGLRKKVDDGDYQSVALVSLELVPGEKWLKEHATELIILGDNGLRSRVSRQFWLVRDSEDWAIVSGSALQDAKTLMKAYETQKSLKSKVIKRELAERVITTAPKDDEDE